MLRVLQRLILIAALLAGGVYLLYQGYRYMQARDALPFGMTIAGLDVGGHSAEQAAAVLEARYLGPLILEAAGQTVELDPQTVQFQLDIPAMLAEATNWRAEQGLGWGYVRFLLGRTGLLPAVAVDLRAAHDPDALREVVQTIAALLDRPARPARFQSGAFAAGEAGYVIDVEAALPDVAAALYTAEARRVPLPLIEQPAPAFDFAFLQANIQRQLDGFSGVGSVYIRDLQTGEEVRINADLPISGLSILKIGIFVEAYRALDGPPGPEVEQLLLETATQSSNYGANLLLNLIAGQPNTYRGADLFTQAMQRLGLVNTFMAIPYDAPAVATRPNTYVTPANSRGPLITEPDPARQTTAEEMGILLAMIYYCARGGGDLLAAYPGQITPEECQAIIDLMILNVEGNLIRFGVPNDVPVSHKHGWDGSTHGDAGIVFSPNGDYVIVTYLHQPTDWLVADLSFPILREIARITYNYFNYDAPYLGDALFEAERFDPDDPFFQSQNADAPPTEAPPTADDAPPTPP